MLKRRQHYPFFVTPKDLHREYTPDEVRQLCLRTKLCVDMTHLNCVWEAKKQMKKEVLLNCSESIINDLLVKSVAQQTAEPFTKEDLANCTFINRSWLKRKNIIRLYRWKSEESGSLKSEPESDTDMDISTSSFDSFVRTETPPRPVGIYLDIDDSESLRDKTVVEEDISTSSFEMPETPPRPVGIYLDIDDSESLKDKTVVEEDISTSSFEMAETPLRSVVIYLNFDDSESLKDKMVVEEEEKGSINSDPVAANSED